MRISNEKPRGPISGSSLPLANLELANSDVLKQEKKIDIRHPAKRSFASDVATQKVGTMRSMNSANGDNNDLRRKSIDTSKILEEIIDKAKYREKNLTKDPNQEKILNSLKILGNYVRTHYANWFNWATIFLHTLGAVLPYVNVVPKKLSFRMKKIAEQFSRYGIPMVKLHTGGEAIYGKRFFEAFARIIPASLIPGMKLPFHNFQLAYGLSSGINVALEHIYGRIGDLKKEDGFAVNNKKVIKGLKEMVQNFFESKTSLKEKSKIGLALGGATCMLGGAIPTLIFDKNGLNDKFARIFGSIRSLGGILGDLSIILFSSQPTQELRNKEKLVGSFYLIPSIMDFAQRWISQGSDANEIFNHAKTALNTIAEVIWSNFSTERNTRRSQINVTIPSGLVQNPYFNQNTKSKNKEDILHIAL